LQEFQEKSSDFVVLTIPQMVRVFPRISKKLMVLKTREFFAIAIFISSAPHTFTVDNTRESVKIQAGMIEIRRIGVCQVGR
jgi:hypothetical protein